MHRSKEQIKGWICLDIDGTLTDDMHALPDHTTNYLHKLYDKGWQLAFVTGRIFSLGHKPLEKLNFPYFFAPQNGASWYEMPGKKRGGKKYLSLSVFKELEPLLLPKQLDFVLITGIEHQDVCYYRPKRLKPHIVEYFQNTLSKLAGQWKPIEDYNSLMLDEFAYGKVYGEFDELKSLQDAFEKISAIKSHLIRDSAHATQYTLHVMRQDVSKGQAVQDLIDPKILPKPIIAAGNDMNDMSLLDIADIKIAMEGSPKPLLEQAHLIAPSVKNEGIIAALQLALKEVEA